MLRKSFQQGSELVRQKEPIASIIQLFYYRKVNESLWVLVTSCENCICPLCLQGHENLLDKNKFEGSDDF